jgi:WhiB family transcriptional regulator, redox-sensing transcriptional regulator
MAGGPLGGYCTDWTGPTPKPSGEIALLAEILRGAPKLDGALCAHHPGVFDGDDAMLTALALVMCRSCPCLARCRQHVEAMRRSRRLILAGVWAGREYHYGTT